MRETLGAFRRGTAGGPWPRLTLILGGAAACAAASLLMVPPYLQSVSANLVMVLAPLAAAASCVGARHAAPPAGRATWLLLALGSILAALGQALYARRDLLGELPAFPSVSFHLLVAFHFAYAEGAILALRPAHEGRSAAEIALDGLLLLLGASAVVLRLVLDEPLASGWLDVPQVVAILIAQISVAASLLFVALLVFWRDTTLAGPVVDGLMVTALLFAFGNFMVTLGLETVPGAMEPSFDLVRLLGWLSLTLTAALATVRPNPSPARARRELAARRFRQLIIPGAALFLAGWALDAAGRETVSVPSKVTIAAMGILLAARIGAAIYAVEQESVERRRAERRAARARLRAVTAQMSPHFLFNALHSLSALVRRDTVATERALGRLGGLLRYGLDSGDQLVLFREEWAFAKNYIEMESLRLGDRLNMRTLIPAEVMDLLVPPFVLQPLVENALRYAVNPFPEGGRVEVRAWREDGRLMVEVQDSGPGADAETIMNAAGVGLRGVRAQLEAHFGQEWRMDSLKLPEGGLLVRLVMPASEE